MSCLSIGRDPRELNMEDIEAVSHHRSFVPLSVALSRSISSRYAAGYPRGCQAGSSHQFSPPAHLTSVVFLGLYLHSLIFRFSVLTRPIGTNTVRVKISWSTTWLLVEVD